MSPYMLTGLLLLAVLATVVLAFVFTPRRAKPVLDSDDIYRDLADEKFERATAGDGYRALGGGKPPARKARDLDEPFRRAAENVKAHPPVEAKSHPGIGKYGETLQPKIFLTPRQLERVNIQRKLRGSPPLNRAGFSNAISHAWDQPRKQPDNMSDWMNYFILYECFLVDHRSSLVRTDIGITIDPNEPYNGHGGEFAGAGASGDWSRGAPLPDAPSDTGGFAPLPPASDPLSDPASFKGSDPTPSYSAPDPTPSYSAPDTSSSPSFDSSPAPLIDTSSSSSSSSNF